MMDHSGMVVGMPFDLRVPFARYVARNGISEMKRYSIEKVFRSKKVQGLHPRELIECAFDIITPTSESLVPDAELVHIIGKNILKYPCHILLRGKIC